MTPKHDPQQKYASPEYLAVGKLRRPHGLRGEIIMEIMTDFPERVQEGVLLYAGESRLNLQIRSSRPHNKVMLLSFEGYDTPEAVGELRNQVVYVRAADRPPLPEGEYYHHELLGLRVIDEDGQQLGEIKGILETGGANDVYQVRTHDGRELLIPDIEDVVLEIDLEAGEMRVHLLPGLLPEV
jgi:16S rRNA processing protein RimM